VRTLILGVLGQDGSYLAQQLSAAGDTVVGMIHGRSTWREGWLRSTAPGIELLRGDLLKPRTLAEVIRVAAPDEIYNLAAITSPGGAWGAPQPANLVDVTGLGVLRLLAAARVHAPDARIVQAGSAAAFDPNHPVQDEDTPIRPATVYGPYGAAKALAHMAVVGHRAGCGAHVSTAILFSHTSPRQDPRFLARRITTAVAGIVAGRQDELVLGDVDACRDWGAAADYMRALPLIARRDTPGDYVIATGTTHTVGDFAEAACAAAGVDPAKHIVIDPALVHRHDIGVVRGDPSRARRDLGWTPTTTFGSMVRHMVRADIRANTEGRPRLCPTPG
jgi:GDPmannose 4,6-dehydratase